MTPCPLSQIHWFVSADTVHLKKQCFSPLLLPYNPSFVPFVTWGPQGPGFTLVLSCQYTEATHPSNLPQAPATSPLPASGLLLATSAWVGWLQGPNDDQGSQISFLTMLLAPTG